MRFHVIDRHDSTVLALFLGGGADLLVDALCFTAAGGDDWLLELAHAGLAPASDDPFFAPLLDYSAEDRYLAAGGTAL